MSDVVMLREQIDREMAAAWQALYGYSQTSSHELITARMRNVCGLYDELKEHVGEERAVEILATSMERQAGIGTGL